MKLLLLLASVWAVASAKSLTRRESRVQVETETEIETESVTRPVCFGVKSSEEDLEKLKTYDGKEIAELYSGELDFSIELFKKIYEANAGVKSQKPQNVFFSPFSVYSALLLAYFGSRGETQTNLEHVLRLGKKDKITAARAYQTMKLVHHLSKQANMSSYDLELANRIFFDKTEPLSDCITQVFGDEIAEMDFLTQSEDSREKINGWVSDVTKGKIENFLKNGDIRPETRMVLANAAYFKGEWQSQFKKDKTKPAIFHLSPSEHGMSKMMFQKGQFRHGVSEELMVHILELPYVGEDISMFLLLPPFVENALETTLSKLNGAVLKEALRNMWKINIEVGVPKFKLENEIELKQALQTMGLNDLFDAASANMTEFSSRAGLYFDSLTHKAVVEVNEEGSEAAAATALIALRTSRPLEPERFICNHPFIFLIYDNMSETILFMGAYRNPKTNA